MTVATTSPQFIEQRAALFAAVEKGDITAIEELFTRDDGLRSQVERTRWYLMPPSREFRKYQYMSIFIMAARAGQYDVIEWFFARERVPIIGATLASVWLSTANDAIDTNNVEILELLLEAGAYIFPQEQLQLQLDSLVHLPKTGDMVRTLLAHGAQIHSERGLAHCATSPTSELVEVFESEGAQFTRADVLASCAYGEKLDAVRRVLQLGVDWACNADALQRAAQCANLALVELYLAEGFVDVDTRNDQGETALMRAAQKDYAELGPLRGDVPAVLRALLAAGADPTLQDHEGRTALHDAVLSEYVEATELLLENGADANAVIMDSDFVHDFIHFHGQDGHIDAKLELLLQYGGRPYARGADDIPFVDQLMMSEAGRRFVESHPQMSEAGRLFVESHPQYFSNCS